MRRNLGDFFADFRPLISRENGHEKFHEKSSAFSTVHQIKFFSLLQLWGLGGPREVPEKGPSYYTKRPGLQMGSENCREWSKVLRNPWRHRVLQGVAPQGGREIYFTFVPPKIEKINLAWKFSIPLEKFNLDPPPPQKKKGFGGINLAWNFQSRMKISILEGDLEFINLGALKGAFFLGQTSCRTKVPRIFRIFDPDFFPNFAPNFPRIFRGFFVLRFVGNGDQKRFTKNPRRFSMQNSLANTKKIFTKLFWRAGKGAFFYLKTCTPPWREPPEAPLEGVLQALRAWSVPAVGHSLGHPRFSGTLSGTLIAGVLRGDTISLVDVSLGQKSCRTKVPRIFRIFDPDFAPNFSPNFPRIFWGFFVLRFVGNGDQKKFTKNPTIFQCKIPRQTRKKYSQNVSGEQAK